MADPTIAGRLIAPLLDACTKLGGAGVRLELARGASLDRAALRDPEARIPLARFFDLIERAAELTGEDLLGMHYSLALDPAAFDVLGFLAVTSPNLGTAFDRIFRYQALLAEGETGTIARARGRVTLTLTMTNWGPPRPAHRMWNEAAMVDMVVNGRQLVGLDFEVIEIRFRHSAPDHVERLRRTLAAPLRFDAEDTALVLPEAVFALPMPNSDPAMFEFFEREAARRVAAQRPIPASMLDEVRQLIAAALPEGVPELATLAQRLACSPRTLQRRLADHGTCLRELIDTLRHELALRHLAAGLAIAEISFLLGFSQPSAFHRAFRRWTHRTPAAWRAERLA